MRNGSKYVLLLLTLHSKEQVFVYSEQNAEQYQLLLKLYTKEKKEKIKADIVRKKAELPDEPAPKKAAPKRTTTAQPLTVRLTAAAILREDALYKKKQAEEAKILKRYEAELHDASEFITWQESQKQKQDQDKKLAIEQRKLEMMLVDERARIARAEQEKANQDLSKQIRDANAQQLQQFEEETQKLVAEKKKKAEAIQESIKEGLQKAAKRLKESNDDKAEEMRLQKKENEMKLAEQLEVERQRKEELILQIKAMESVRPDRKAIFDPTETQAHGILGEMSFAELQKRLDDLREKNKKAQVEKRKDIVEQKKTKDAELLATANKIASYRQNAKRESIKKKLQDMKEKQIEDDKLKKERDTKLLEMQQKLEEHRERRRVELKQKAEEEKQRNFNNADGAHQEFRHFGEQEKGAERETKARYQSMLNEYFDTEQLKSHEEQQRTANNTLATQLQTQKLEQKENEYQQKNNELQQTLQTTQQKKRDHVQQVRQQRETRKTETKTSLPTTQTAVTKQKQQAKHGMGKQLY